MSIIQGTSKTAGGGYEIDQSIRFDNVDGVNAGGAQMYRLALTGTPTNDKKATISAWVKRATLGYNQTIAYSGDPNGSTFEGLRFNTNDTILFSQASSVYTLTTTQVFRDVGAWYHIVAEIDTANGTAADRANLYVNGEKVTSFSTATYPSLNYVTNWTASSASIAHAWGTNGIPAAGPSSQLFAGYMAEMYVLDGEKAGPTAFGEFNDSGVWIPKAYSGAFGNNGYYMTGENASALGEDFSGNNLDFTTVALATTDQMLDTPTDNFCTLNAVDKATQVVLADGNLQYGLSSNSYTAVRGTFGISSGKWYWEMSTVSGMAVNTCYMGIATNASNLQVSNAPGDGTTYTYISYTGNKAYTSGSAYGTAWNTNGRVIGVALDLDAGKIWWSRDGVWQASGDPAAGTNEAFSGITGTWHPYVVFNDTSPNLLFNFGQSAFTYTPPTGFNTLSTANLPTPSITDGSAYFQPTLYTGTGSSLAVTQSGNSTFQPDWVWIKGRSGATEHVLTDAVRGVTKELSSNDTGAEETVAQGLTTFGSAGFTVGTDGSYNTSSATYVGWQWKANGAGSSNTDGTISSTVSADTTSGFSIVRYAGNLSTTGSATVGHGLGIAPSVVISKSLDSTAGDSGAWAVQHTSLPASNILRLNTTAATSDKSGNGTLSSPTSTVFYTNYTEGLNVTGNDYIAYCFAEVEGFSSIGSYTGNGSATDGPFVYTGFRPAFVMTKRIDSTSDWTIEDTTRSTFNLVENALFPNLNIAEDTTGDRMDILSNGFKLRTTAQPNVGTLIYMAFAEHPFGGDGVAPATAR
jgi:hypothetical protein